MDKKNEKSMSWEDFQSLGNPENAPEETEEVTDVPSDRSGMQVRLHYEKKGRGGKEAVIIRGLDVDEAELSALCKDIKTALGVGGSAKDGEIIIQGRQRDRIFSFLQSKGFKQIKNSGG